MGGGREATNMFRAVVVPARKAVVRISRVLWRCISSIENGGCFLFLEVVQVVFGEWTSAESCVEKWAF